MAAWLSDCLGERIFSRYGFRDVLEQRMVDIIQPDLSHCGGITEVFKVAAMAEAYDVAIAPHCPLGPCTLAASLHLDFVSYNAFIQEQSMAFTIMWAMMCSTIWSIRAR